MLVNSSNSVLRGGLSDNVSTFIADSNQTNAMGWDPQERLISVQRARGDERVGVLYPPEQVTTLADNYQGEPFVVRCTASSVVSMMSVSHLRRC